MQPLLSADNLSLRLGQTQILSNVSLSLNHNEVVTLIGPNGAGKSSLVKVLLGLISPTSGSVKRQVDLRVGYVPQHFNVDASMPMTVRYLLQLANNVDAASVASKLSITHLLERPLHKLSGGEKQRVLMARALLSKPNLLVLDEPAQGVDVVGQAELYLLINQIKDELGCSVLVVSHDLHLVMASTDRVICLNHHICCHGHPTDVQTDPAYQSLLGERGVEAMALYKHHHDHHHGIDGDICDDGGCDGNH